MPTLTGLNALSSLVDPHPRYMGLVPASFLTRGRVRAHRARGPWPGCLPTPSLSPPSGRRSIGLGLRKRDQRWVSHPAVGAGGTTAGCSTCRRTQLTMCSTGLRCPRTPLFTGTSNGAWMNEEAPAARRGLRWVRSGGIRCPAAPCSCGTRGPSGPCRAGCRPSARPIPRGCAPCRHCPCGRRSRP